MVFQFDAPVSALLFHDSLKQHFIVVLVDGRIYVCSNNLAEATVLQTNLKGCDDRC
jgi:hypothetical protein